MPIQERWQRIEARNAEGTWGAVPISRDYLEQWDGFFETPDEAEIDLFDSP